MKFRLLVSLIGLFLTSTALAQKSVKIKVINQYEAPVDKFTVEGIEYNTSKDGTVSILVNDADSLTFAGKEYDEKNIAVSSIIDGASIELYKRFTWKDIFNPKFYIEYGGLWLLLFIIFAETGLLIGFFFPGDSLLFVAGIYSGNLANEFLELVKLDGLNNEWLDLLVLCGLISLAGILGNLVGYWTGRKVGPAMYKWNDNLLFKKKYLFQAKDFYDLHGGGAIIFARFLPFIRTFAPIVAGIVGMDKKKFTFYNIVGCIAWVVTMIFAGHFLQIWVEKQFGIDLKEKLELIVIIIIAVTTAPVLWKFFFGKKKEEPKAN